MQVDHIEFLTIHSTGYVGWHTRRSYRCSKCGDVRIDDVNECKPGRWYNLDGKLISLAEYEQLIKKPKEIYLKSDVLNMIRNEKQLTVCVNENGELLMECGTTEIKK